MHRVADSMIVQLILASGSHAGIAAPIQCGYYMIGRHPECQIRPKTRSVSRRHSLLHHDENELLVIDLGSTSGTRINNEKIEPKRWYPLSDGDVLRFGKTVFHVSLQPSAHAFSRVVSGSAAVSEAIPETTSRQRLGDDQREGTQEQEAEVPAVNSGSAPPASNAPAKGAASIVQGEAWEEFDVASFLQNADESDRQRRYESIRQSDAARRAEELDDEGDIFEDTPIETDEATLADIKSNVGGSKSQLAAPTASQAATVAAKEAATTSATATRMAARRSDAPPPKTSRFSRRFSFANLANLDIVKTSLAVLVTLAVLGYAGFSAYHLIQGPPIEIVEGID